MTGYASTTKSRRLDFVYAEGKVIAVHVMEGNSESLYYLLTDHLGSWNKVMDENKNIVQQTHFDPWGNFIEWKTESGKRKTFHFPLSTFHLSQYAPVIGRFFSPDPFVQAPDFTQNFKIKTYKL